MAKPQKEPKGEADSEDTYSEAETIRRREAALKRLLDTPPQPRTKKEPGERAKRGRPKKGGE